MAPFTTTTTTTTTTTATTNYYYCFNNNNNNNNYTTMSNSETSLVDNFFDPAHLYGLSFRKLDSFYNTRRDSVGLRKWVLIQNFVNQRLIEPVDSTYEPLEWSEEDIKKDEENWLDAQLDGLDEEEDFEAGYVYISRSNESLNKGDTMMITEEIQGDQQTIITSTTTYIDGLMDIDYEMPELQETYRINPKNNSIMKTDDIPHRSFEYHYDHHLFTTSVDHNYHHWKDKSTISTTQLTSSPLSQLKPINNSELDLPSISAYRPFFEPCPSSSSPSPPPPSSQSQTNSHPSLKIPGLFRKYCLDRDYLVGINPAEIGDVSPNDNGDSNITLPLSLGPYSTPNAALLNLVKLYNQSANTKDNMALISPSIVPPSKIPQGDVTQMLGYDLMNHHVRHDQITTTLQDSKIWFIGAEEKDNDPQKMVSL